jgi:hypothetical protein
VVAAPTGTLPLRSLQLGIEGTRGVGEAAQVILPALSVELNPQYPKSRREEQRGSFIKHYRNPIVTGHMVSLGIEVIPTFEETAYWFALALRGGITVATSASTVKTRTYTPVATSDNLKTASIEVVTDTQNYTIPFCVVNRLSFGWEKGGPATMQIDLLGQQLTAASKTAALATIASEEINPSTALAYIDASTIGSTAVTNVRSFNWTVENGFAPLPASNGNNYPVNFYRAAPRSMTTQMTVDFVDTTEFGSLVFNTARKIRTKITGSTIASSTGNVARSITTDWYGFHDEGPFAISDGMTQVRFSSESVYDSTATHDWSVAVATVMAAISAAGES